MGACIQDSVNADFRGSKIGANPNPNNTNKLSPKVGAKGERDRQRELMGNMMMNNPTKAPTGGNMMMNDMGMMMMMNDMGMMMNNMGMMMMMMNTPAPSAVPSQFPTEFPTPDGSAETSQED